MIRADEAAAREDRADVEAALARDPVACRRLVARVTPTIQRRVAGALRRRPGRSGEPQEAEILDLTQDVLLALFASDGRILRSWDPAQGASLPGFCGLVAERLAVSILRSGRRGGGREDATALEDFDRAAPPSTGPGPVVEDRQFLAALLDRLRAAFNPRSLSLFHALYVEEKEPEVVAAAHGMTVDAVYIWRSRARKLLQATRDELLAEGGGNAAVAAKMRVEARVSR